MYTADFHNDLKLLSINIANTLFPKATENITEQIELIKTLEQKGFTYQISDGVYFDTSKDIHYTDFARLDIEGMKELDQTYNLESFDKDEEEKKIEREA
jgi:cysteinyl-tRNA synthetase